MNRSACKGANGKARLRRVALLRARHALASLCAAAQPAPARCSAAGGARLRGAAAPAGAGVCAKRKGQSKRTCTSWDSALIRLLPSILPAAKPHQPVPRCAWISRCTSGPSCPPWPRARDPGTLDPHHRADGVRALHVYKRMSRPSQGQLILWCSLAIQIRTYFFLCQSGL